MYTHNKVFYLQILFLCFLPYIFGAPQFPEKKGNQAEIPDQFEKQPESVAIITTTVPSVHIDQSTINPDVSPETTPTTIEEIHEATIPIMYKEISYEPAFTTKLYTMVVTPIRRFMATPKVNMVLRNIGTCVVNGAMELISYFFPTPLMPLIASAAGMIIPFEPVVMLRERMPVTSYRRAIKTAVNSFLDTFDQYKVAQDEDPYMTRQFNRRFMNDDGRKKKVRS